jgi:pimeloyl-ACP methyl ester carboxylesterase
MAEVADDLRDLTIAAHLDRVSVAASAFSTPAAIQFARANPTVVTSLLLTNPTPPRESVLANPTLSLSKSFAQIAARCAAQPACARRFGELGQQFGQRVAEYDARPRLATAMALGPTQPGVPVLLDGRRMGAALAAALASSEQLPIVPSALAPDGVDPQLLAAAAINQEVHYYAGRDAIAGAALSFFCSYDAQTNRTAEISDAALRQFAGASDPTFQPMCSAWNVPSVFDRLSQPLAGDLPVLLVEGGISTSGANRWSEEMVGTLDHATVLRLDTLSEDVSYVQPPCLRDIRERFLLHPDADLSTAVAACAAQSPPIEFVGT